MNQQDIGPREVERRAGIGHKIINEWRRNARKPDLDCIIAALNVVGLRLCVRETDFVDGKEIVPVSPMVTTRPVTDDRFEIVC